MNQFIYGAQHDTCGILGSQYTSTSSHEAFKMLGCIYNEGAAEEVNPQCLRSFLKFSSPFSRSSCCFLLCAPSGFHCGFFGNMPQIECIDVFGGLSNALYDGFPDNCAIYP